MAGIKQIKLLLAIIIPFFAIFLMSQNTFALYTSQYGVRVLSWDNNVCGDPTYTEQHYYNQYFSGCGITTIVPISSSVTATGDTVVYSGKMNLVKELNQVNSNDWKPYPYIGIRSVYFAGNQLILQQQPVINYWITHWSDNINGVNINYSTLTIQWSFIATGNINNTTGNIRISLYNDQPSETFDYPGFTNQTNYYYFEPTADDVQLVFTDNGSSYYNQMINQNQTLINQNQSLINQQKEFYEQQYDAAENIGSQSENDITGTTDQQTTNLIGVITNFISVISGLSTTSTNCSITLPFPEFAGGSQTLNICSGKNYWGGQSIIGGNNFFAIIGRLMLICFFVPLCYILLKMIYNEIRSWTNG